MLFICFHHFLTGGLSLIAPLGRRLFWVALVSHFSTNNKTVSADSDGSARQRGTFQIKEKAKMAHKNPKHAV